MNTYQMGKEEAIADSIQTHVRLWQEAVETRNELHVSNLRLKAGYKRRGQTINRLNEKLHFKNTLIECLFELVKEEIPRDVLLEKGLARVKDKLSELGVQAVAADEDEDEEYCPRCGVGIGFMSATLKDGTQVCIHCHDAEQLADQERTPVGGTGALVVDGPSAAASAEAAEEADPTPPVENTFHHRV